MIDMQNVKNVVGLAPISINSGAATPLAVDTSGYSYATAIVSFGVIGGAATVMRLTECETSGGTYTAITGLTASGSTGDGRLPQTADAGTSFMFNVPLGAGSVRKKFLTLEITTGATTLVQVTWILSRAAQTPNTAAERGVSGYLSIP